MTVSFLSVVKSSILIHVVYVPLIFFVLLLKFLFQF
jgi:hypothetical protein